MSGTRRQDTFTCSDDTAPDNSLVHFCTVGDEGTFTAYQVNHMLSVIKVSSYLLSAYLFYHTADSKTRRVV
jgi:hypothetical protein